MSVADTFPRILLHITVETFIEDQTDGLLGNAVDKTILVVNIV